MKTNGEREGPRKKETHILKSAGLRGKCVRFNLSKSGSVGGRNSIARKK